MAQRDWIGERAALLARCLSERGLTIELNEARDIIAKRVSNLSETMGITSAVARGYVTDEAISDLAEMLAGLLADEAPGIDLMQEPRSVLLSQKLVGRAVAGLAEAILFYHRHGDDSASTWDQIRELAEHLSIFGALVAESSMPAAQIPPAMVSRIAARLDRAAAHPDVPEELAVAWRRDAMRLRSSL